MSYGYESSTTFYTEHGDWFAWSCWLGVGVALFCSPASSLHSTQTRYPCRITRHLHP